MTEPTLMQFYIKCSYFTVDRRTCPVVVSISVKTHMVKTKDCVRSGKNFSQNIKNKIFL